MNLTPPPETSEALMFKAEQLSGLSFKAIAALCHTPCPSTLLHAKGWLGQRLEQLLGAQSGSKALPDFAALGIELKTLPLNASGYPKESTYVTYAPIPFQEPNWHVSLVYSKLKQVLWFPYLAEGPIPERRLGMPFLWKMSQAWEALLQKDWQELAEKLKLQQFQDLHGRVGQYLHIRPKAPNSKTFIQTLDSYGQPSSVVPKGFYLRTEFTHRIIQTIFGV